MAGRGLSGIKTNTLRKTEIFPQFKTHRNWPRFWLSVLETLGSAEKIRVPPSLFWIRDVPETNPRSEGAGLRSPERKVLSPAKNQSEKFEKGLRGALTADRGRPSPTLVIKPGKPQERFLDVILLYFCLRNLKKVKLSGRVVTSDQQNKDFQVLPSIKVRSLRKD